MIRITFLIIIAIMVRISGIYAQLPDAVKWHKYELVFSSSADYENPVQDVRTFEVIFTSPSGIKQTVNGFWDGNRIWKARFMPFESGKWSYVSNCSDVNNTGLSGQKGDFNCIVANESLDLYKHGPIMNPPGTYHLAHSDGKPFFWLACTAWNGALLSTDAEWSMYLANRAKNSYSAIQYVTTQWRAAEKSSEDLVAFEGSGRIRINPEFFRLIDRKTDMINDAGLVAAPVLLWALPVAAGRELSPGYYLPDDQAILLAKYIVARLGGNHVVWILGGDGNYTGTFEQRWKTIGRGVFNGKNQGLVAQHPQGTSWIGELYKDEPWLNIIGYQSSHSIGEGTVNWITKGPVSKSWKYLPPRPLINLEPVYEEIRNNITSSDVRNACYWSIFASPVAGITYGANGIWPWLKEGEKILNHSDAPWTSTWNRSLELPASVQVGYLAGFFRKIEWWSLYPAQDLLVDQPGDKTFNHYVSILKRPDNKLILAYLPFPETVQIRIPDNHSYTAKWFDPVKNEYASGTFLTVGNIITVTPVMKNDAILILEETRK